MAPDQKSTDQKTPIRVGQIGVGHLGEKRCAVLRTLPDVELVGVHDIDPQRNDHVAEALGVQGFHILEDLLAAVDAAVVAVPTREHFSVVHQALNHGVHVLVEKPIAATVEEAEALVVAADRHGRILQVGHVERFNPAILNLAHERLDPIFIEAQRLASFDRRGTDVPVVLDLMIHDLDIVLNVVRHPIKEIRANGVAMLSSHIDFANARLEFENGCIANLTASRIAPQRLRKMQFFQPDAYISVDFLERSTEIYRLVNGRRPEGRTEDRPSNPSRPAAGDHFARETLVDSQLDPLTAELQAFMESVRSGEPPLVDGVAGCEVLGVAIEIARIIEGGSRSGDRAL